VPGANAVPVAKVDRGGEVGVVDADLANGHQVFGGADLKKLRL
jgi:hypothetical protein